jgi:dTDP-glucose 4,6-dehydratase
LQEGEPGGVYNVGGGEEVENGDLTARILELTGANESLIRHVEDRPGHDRRYSLDTAKLRSLGWEPKHTLADGLPETVAWYRDNRDWWEPIKSGEYLAYYRRQYAARLS